MVISEVINGKTFSGKQVAAMVVGTKLNLFVAHAPEASFVCD